MITIKIQEAFYGEVSKAHSLITSSCEDKELNSFLQRVTDRPAAIPPSVKLLPYSSFYSFKEYFVFLKTFPDLSATRGGMVFTHALIVDLDQACSLKNLNVIYDEFVKEIPARDTLSPRTMEKNVFSEETENLQEIPSCYLKILRALLLRKYPIPFISDSDGFDSLVRFLWLYLRPELKKALKGRISFSPQDIDNDDPPILIQVDKVLEGKWAGYNAIDASEQMPVQLSDTDKILLDLSESEITRLFIKTLGFQPQRVEDFYTLANLYQLYSTRDSQGSSQLVRLVRLLANVSPDPKQAKEVKNEVLHLLLEAIRTDENFELHSIRNVNFETYENGTSRVAALMETSIERKWNTVVQDAGDEFAEQLMRAFSPRENSPEWWCEPFIHFFKQTLSELDQTGAEKFWKLVRATPELLTNIASFLPDKTEVILTDALPGKISPELGEKIMNFSRSKNWFVLYARVLMALKPMKQAIQEILDVEVKSQKGLQRIIDSVQHEEFIRVAVEQGGDVLLQTAGDLCGKEPNLLVQLNIENPNWRMLWNHTLQVTGDFSRGIKEPQKVAAKIYELLISDVSIGEGTLQALAKSDYGDISDHQDIDDLLSKIPWISKKHFVYRAANTLADRIAIGTTEINSVNREIVAAMKDSQFVSEFVGKNNMAAVVNYLEAIGGRFDDLLSQYISRSSKELDAITAARLGNYVAKYRLWKASRAVLTKARYNSSFEIALGACGEMFSYMERIANFYWFRHSFSADDFWKSCAEILVRLYEKGPEDKDIWKRAGGDVTLLSNSSSRAENWTRAIGLLRNGIGGITVDTLIEEAQTDYKNNSDLKTLKELKKHLGI